MHHPSTETHRLCNCDEKQKKENLIFLSRERKERNVSEESRSAFQKSSSGNFLLTLMVPSMIFIHTFFA
jgi:hypothetical protein